MNIQQHNVWNALDHAKEYAQQKKNRSERVGGNACKVYNTARTMYDQQMHGLNAFGRAAFEASLLFKQVCKNARSEFSESLRTDLTDDDYEVLI